MKAPRMIGHRTGPQITAGDPTQSVWVGANAGTGKTHVLIDRISRLLLAGTRPERILCLTFTKAAAAEMANRLSAQLGSWAVMDDDALEIELQALVGRRITADDRARARRLLAETLETPEGLKIRTIHAFCESLLGRFPLEAGIAPHFSVLDERSAAELRAEARDRMLTRTFDQGNDAIARALEHMAGLVDEERFADAMGELDRHRGRLQRLLAHHGSLNGLIGALRTALAIGEDDTEETVLAAAADTGAFDGDGLATACAALDEGSPADQGRAASIRAWLADGADRVDLFHGAYKPLFLTAKEEPRAEKTLITKAAQAADSGALGILLAEQARIAAVIDRLRALRVAEATDALLTIGTALLETYEDLKRARALLDYDDLILTAKRLLEGAGQATWVHYKLDQGLEHILVDEAQDTSPDQWDVIKALAEEFFTGAGAADVVRTIFAVGDEKQSIYSFQGADPEEFGRMRDHFAARARTAHDNWQSVELAGSYRSILAILRAVDQTFEAARARDGLTAAGAEVRHLLHRTCEAGLVEIWPTITPGETPAETPWDAPLDQVSAESPSARLARRITDRIDDWLCNGEVLEAAGRPIRPDDIMILVRTRGSFADEMVRALKQRGIPVAGSDRMVLTEQLAVMDLIALGRFLLSPDDDLTLAVVLKSPLVGLDDGDLFKLAYRRPGTLWHALGEARPADRRFDRAWTMLSALLAKADFAPPFEFFADVLGPGAGRRQLVARLGLDANDPIDEFLGLALLHERDHAPSLQGFLHWLEAGAVEIKRDLDHGRHEVRVLTVHGAKGLQSPIVFLPDTCTVPHANVDPRIFWDKDGGGGVIAWPAYRDNEEALCRRLHEEARRRIEREYRRLLYVAMTRARDRLYVCGWENTRGRADGCWYDLIADAVRGDAEEVTLPFGEIGGEIGWRLYTPQTAPVDSAVADRLDGGPAAAAPAWTAQPAPEEPRPGRPLAPSRPSAEEPAVRSPFGDDDGARFIRGRIIHRLLQSLPDLTPQARAAAARVYLARPAHGLDEAAQEEIVAETMAVLENPAFAAFFGATSRAEVAIVGALDGHVLSGQIDRLLVEADAITVIDYKTNRPAPVDVDAVPEIYLKQMAAYRAALRRIYPDRPVRCHLLWTDGPRLMELPDALVAAHAP